MDPRLHSDIVSCLDRDYAFKVSKDGKYLQGGKCPSCHKKEMYTSAEHPWVLRCPRGNKCGVEYHVKELYPDLFASWSDRYKATPAEPNAAADAYLKNGRGFDLAKIAGWYAQENYYNSELKLGSATVRFPLADGVWWERIIDRPDRFDRKANFRGQYGGMWWMPASITEIPEELWIVEGIFDSIALLHHDIAAASAMSSTNYPAAALRALAERCKAEGKPKPKLVWAFDGGRAGRKASRQFHQRSRTDGWEATAAMIPMEGKKEPDWNDMHQRGRLEKKHIEEYRHEGALLLAPSAEEKAELIHRKRNWMSFHFEFDSCLHWFKVGDDNKHIVTEIANCYPVPLYYQANLVTDESWYYFRVESPNDGGAVKNTFTAGQLSSPSEFKKRLLGVAPGAIFTGSAGQLDSMLKRWLRKIKTVQTVDFIGYSAEHKCWVFNEIAVKDGKASALNDEDFFDLGRLSVKSLGRSLKLKINPTLKEFSAEWVPLLWECYAYKGVVALAYWLGSLFAEQIRDKQASYPFLELVGEPGAGKTTLIEFMWKLCGRPNYEGFDPARSSIAGRARNFAQVANLPVVLIESDRGGDDRDRMKQRAFDWEELKNLYDGGAIYSRGVKNSGNDTYEPNFRGSIVIAQNAPVQATEAIMQRLLHVSFDLASHTDSGKAAGDALKAMDVERVSGFILKATLAEAAILATVAERIPHHEQRLKKVPGVRNFRIVKNHAQLAALVDALAHVVALGKSEIEQTQAFIEDMALERQESINSDHPIVVAFWEIYEFLNGEQTLNHARGEERIAVNFPHFVEKAMTARQQLPDMSELKKALRSSRVYKFVEANKTVNSAINAEWNRRIPPPDAPRAISVKCWVFQKPAAARGNS